MYMQELELAKSIAREAGALILSVYQNFDETLLEYKKDQSPVTKADKLANSFIVEELKRHFPEYAVLSEEGMDDKERLKNENCFIVDRLDGTKEFLKRNNQFTVNIALAHKHRSVMGVIYVPASGELYYAAQGAGAWKEEHGGKKSRLSVTDISDLNDVRVVISNSHDCQEMEDLIEKYQFQHLERIGSSLKGCLIAEGKAEIYYRFNPTMEWDTAAMQCIVEEAGAVFRQMDDTLMLYNRENSKNEKGFYIINRPENKLC